ncbi:MAG: peptide-methionine (S)-S-oxide reductase MsrA [Flavobacteriaceae bacterium]|nr:peptide-methionine (S)-S-oxide reductase MsrA [Flavobacteriaceae bacterium]
MTQLFKTAIFAGGCFWCTEAVFNRIEGVKQVISGYTGGFIKNPAYREVCEGRTGHAEATKIIFDKSKVVYKDLLEIFFATHDPTTLNRQGNDVGSQYRSAIFYLDKEQRDSAEDFIALLNDSDVFENPIVTEINKFEVFYDAENNHQDYYDNNRQHGYCQVIINPKLKKLEKQYQDKLK